jgi:predicted nuclease with TOPRIM domain
LCKAHAEAAKVKADCERRIFELHQENNVLVHLSDKRTIDLAEWKEKCSRVQQERDEANSQNTTADREWRMKLTAAEEDLKSARDDNNSLQEGLAKLEQHHADAIHLSELFNYYCVLAQTRVPYLERFMHHLGPYIVYW